MLGQGVDMTAPSPFVQANYLINKGKVMVKPESQKNKLNKAPFMSL